MPRALLLNGFMATGKSSVARLVAEQLHAHWVDLDAAIEARAQLSIKEIFAQRGEPAFRELERQTLFEVLAQAEQRLTVVSLGGGALVQRELRVDILQRAIVVTLQARPETILERVRAQDGASGSRPLLAGSDPAGAVERLLQERRLAYLESHGVVETDGRSLQEIAVRVQEIYQADSVVLAAGEQTYQVHIGAKKIQALLADLVGSCSKVLFVTDQNVAPLHGDKVRAALKAHVPFCEVELVPGEEHKNLQGLSGIYQAAFENSIDRKSKLVGLGGGVVTDMTGFAAATWVRGVDWVGLPTTLLSMVDASVGGKTGVDFNTAKNSVGAFWQPQGVICDVETLLTESQRAYVGALSEVVKTALIGDAALLSLLEENAERILARDLDIMRQVVERSVRVKARVVALDEREAGIRATLNLGHTIGHALESSGGYTALTHGEAVSLGLVAALRLGEKKGHTPAALSQRVLLLLKRLGLPHRLERADLERSAGLIGLDKKRAGSQVRFVYAGEVEQVFTESIQLDELTQVCAELAD